MKTYRVYFEDGNQKLFNAENLYVVALITKDTGIVTKIEEII